MASSALVEVPRFLTEGQACLEGLCGFAIGDEIVRHWDGDLVLLSMTIACFGAFTTLRTVAHMRYCEDDLWYWTFLLLSGLSFGALTVWDMHQVGMEAVKLVATNVDGMEVIVDVRFGLSFAIISGLAAWAVGALGIWIITGRSFKLRNKLDSGFYFRLTVSSLVVAMGVCIMHYMGMLSMTGNFEMEWDASIVLLSFLIAGSVAWAGLWLLMCFPATTTAQLTAAAIIGSAVCGMHYSGMAAATYYITATEQSFTGEQGYNISGITVAILGLIANILLTIPLQHYSEEMRSRSEKKAHDEHVAEQQRTIAQSSEVAKAMVDYDLPRARALINQCTEDDPNMQPLMMLLKNLAVYRAFLPHALFDTSKSLLSMPNDTLGRELDGQSASMKDIAQAVARLRDPDYTLLDFHMHMTNAYPELNLYTVGEGKFSSGHTGIEEYQRTLGALYTVFAFFRLDIDGKDILTFGVNAHGLPRSAPLPEEGEAGKKKQKFCDAMEWTGLINLMVRAGLLVMNAGQLIVAKERAMAMLALTAFHDIMKNKLLLPIVQKEHAPFNGCAEGEEITDHDLALGYVLEHYPSLLPSFSLLTPAQRAPVLFTQAKMHFNNGWLVQAEAPPGVLFKSFRAAIQQGRASESDVSFYFVHWITDLAGAEPFADRPWPGAEKLTIKLPPHVLRAFVDSFQFVERLATASEVQVMDAYLRHRMDELKIILPKTIRTAHYQVAAMRLVLMAQGFEEEVLYGMMTLIDEDVDVLGCELARTACKEQFIEAPEIVRHSLEGPALLAYYAPALIQKAGSAEAREALIVLARVLQAARQMFPLSKSHCEESATIRIEVLKALKPADIKKQIWFLKQTTGNSAEVVAGEALAGDSVADGSIGTAGPMPVIMIDIPQDMTCGLVESV